MDPMISFPPNCRVQTHAVARGGLCVGHNMDIDAQMDPNGSIFITNRVLPFEIVSIIASYLYDRHIAMNACASTCRLWRDAIHQHRWCQIVVTKESQLQDLLRYIENRTVLPHWVQEIVSMVPPQRILLKMINLAAHLPRLHTLEFRGLQRDVSVDRAAITKVFSQFQTVDTLRFRRSHVGLSFIQSAAYALPNLACMEFEQGGFLDEDPIPDLGKDCHLHLVSLRVDKTQQCGSFFRWITRIDPPVTVRSFAVDGVDSLERLRDAAEFIRALGPSVEHLSMLALRQRIDHFREMSYRTAIQHINLSNNSNIRTLDFYDPLHPGIIVWLGQLPNPELLETVNLFMPSRDVTSDYHDLDACLARPELSGLKDVHVRYQRALRPVDPDVVRQDLENGFPITSRRGILRLTITHL